MTDKDPAKTKQLLQEIIDSQQFRIILSKGWAEMGIERTNHNTFLVDYVPHSKLFPKMAGIVHLNHLIRLNWLILTGRGFHPLSSTLPGRTES
jgi:hypothetical protein